MFRKRLKGICCLIITVFFMASATSAHDSKSETFLSVEDMLVDFNTLHRILHESHPNPYRYITETEAEKNWRRTRQKITKPLTQMQFLNLLNPVFSQYNDGHTYLDIPFKSQIYKNYVRNGGLFFPFQIWKSGEKFFVKGNLGAFELPRGTEIVQINGKPAREIYLDLTNAVSGDSQAYKSATALRLFSPMYWQRFEHGNEFTLKIRRPNRSKIETVIAGGITGEQLESSINGVKAIDSYELTPEIFVLEINKMDWNDKVKKFIDDAFAQVKEKNYPVLVLDIRRNGGGSSVVGNWVFDYLTRKRYGQSAVKEVRLSPYLTANNEFFREWTEKLKLRYPTKGDRLVQKAAFTKYDGAETDSEKWIYEGKAYLLTATQTYSSGFMMAETFKCYGFGTMVGHQPGSYRNLTGELMQFRLPKSGLTGYVATSQFFPPCYEKEKTDFLSPDVEIRQTLEDLIGGRDTVLEYVKKTALKDG